MKPKRTEHGEASTLFEYVIRMEGRYPELRLFHAVPNGAKLGWGVNKRGERYSREAIKLKEEGLRSGVPDYSMPAPRKGKNRHNRKTRQIKILYHAGEADRQRTQIRNNAQSQ